MRSLQPRVRVHSVWTSCAGAIVASLAAAVPCRAEVGADFLVDAEKNHASPAFRKQAARALARIDSVP